MLDERRAIRRPVGAESAHPPSDGLRRLEASAARWRLIGLAALAAAVAWSVLRPS